MGAWHACLYLYGGAASHVLGIILAAREQRRVSVSEAEYGAVVAHTLLHRVTLDAR